MAVALVGLSGFQVYWINNVIKLSEERFEKDALASMQQVAQKIERNEMVYVAANSFASFGNSSLGEDDTTIMDLSIEMNGSGDSTSSLFEFKTNSNNNVKIIVRTDSNREIHEFINDTTNYLTDVHVTSEVNSVEPVAKETIARLHKKQKVFTKVVEEMIFLEAKQPQRIHPVIIDSLLRQEFLSHGIHLKFEFGIFDTNESKFKIVKTKNRDQLELSTLKASLFPNDILGNSLSLIVNFPDKNKYLFDKIWASLLTSILFILMIIGAFSYVVYKIIHQKKLSDLKNDFINNMTHEFKTPIATVSLATEALQEETVYSSQETMLRYVGVIQEEAKRLGAQVEKVLQLASMEKENLSLHKEPTSLNLLVEATIERARFQVEERDGMLEVNLSDELTDVLADETHMANAIFNLLDNAIKYSPEAPKIKVSTLVKESQVIVKVEDKGIGLSKEQQNHIFDKFYRVPTGNLHDVKGFGLGLNYVRFVVEAHDGQVKVKSQFGGGSAFKIIIPIS
jgi:two-component system phosphate regulon sensor histidine kinase PhoR